MLLPILLVVAAYLLGAVPFGYLVARWRGVDILRQGSGNIGATNVARVLGRRYGILVFVLDFAKGAIPVLAGRFLSDPSQHSAQAVPVAAGIAAFLGHLFPIYLRFRGGKGVATAAGAVMVLLPVPGLAAFLTWLTVFVSSRIMSLASILGAVVLCLLRLLTTPAPWSPSEIVLTCFCLVAAALVVARHHANIRRLLSGTENRFQESPAMTHLCKSLHLFALSLWFGTMVFFTLTGALLFTTFDRISSLPSASEPRPVWLPVPKEYDRPSLPGFPDPLRREQGSRIGGAAVAPLFPWYYGIQTVCVLVALVTALAWVGRRERVHRLRVWVLLAAVAAVGVGWWLDIVVSDLRGPRNDLTDQVLAKPAPTDAEIAAAAEARAAFGRWHGYSLMDNFATLLLVTIAVALAASLPAATAAAGASTNGHPTAQAKEHAAAEPRPG
jgi:acyl-phosphate glycerol 3-phosphate acyltransferase